MDIFCEVGQVMCVIIGLLSRKTQLESRILSSYSDYSINSIPNAISRLFQAITNPIMNKTNLN